MQSYEYAVKYDDTEGIATYELAKLYRNNNQIEDAIKCYLQHWIKLNYIEIDSYHITKLMLTIINIDNILAEIILYVSNYFYNKKYYEYSEEYCSLLLEYIGPEGEEARALLRQLRSHNNILQNNISQSNISQNNNSQSIILDRSQQSIMSMLSLGNSQQHLLSDNENEIDNSIDIDNSNNDSKYSNLETTHLNMSLSDSDQELEQQQLLVDTDDDEC